MEKLRTLYYDRGFLNHRISVQGKTHITFIIEEGPLYKVRNIALNGNTVFDNETLLADLDLETDEIYYQRKALAHEKRILKHYREIGYVDADVRRHLRKKRVLHPAPTQQAESDYAQHEHIGPDGIAYKK